MTERPDSDRPLPACPGLPVEDLVAWIDGELAAGDARRVASHVTVCAACARESDLLRRSGELLSRLPGHAPPEGFDGRVLHALRTEQAPAAAPAGRVIRPAHPSFSNWSFPRSAAAAAAVLVVAAGTWWIASGPGDPSRLSSRDEEEIARDLYVIAHLETLGAADADELASIADDLDVIDTATDSGTDGDGG